eukprot:1636336-Prymnesium_polylepis.1
MCGTLPTWPAGCMNSVARVLLPLSHVPPVSRNVFTPRLGGDAAIFDASNTGSEIRNREAHRLVSTSQAVADRW